MAAVKTRQIRNSLFIDILNDRSFLRMFNAMASEYVAEFNLTNNTLVVKLIDRIKYDRFKRGKLEIPKKTSITSFSSTRFGFGRYNTIQIARVLNLLNIKQNLKGRFGFTDEEVIQTLLGMGTTSVVATAVTKKDLQQERDAWNRQGLGFPGRNA